MNILMNTSSAYEKLYYFRKHLWLFEEEMNLTVTDDPIAGDAIRKRNRVIELSNYQKDELLRVFQHITEEYEHLERNLIGCMEESELAL